MSERSSAIDEAIGAFEQVTTLEPARPVPVWVTVDAERALYADRGRTPVLCDRFPEPVTLVLKLTGEQIESIRREFFRLTQQEGK